MQKVLELFKLTPLKIGLILTLLIVVLIKFDPGIIEILELQLLDQRLRARGELTPGPEVVIVAIDEKSQPCHFTGSCQLSTQGGSFVFTPI